MLIRYGAFFLLTVFTVPCLLLLPATAAPPQKVTMEDFFRRQCEAGNQRACERQAALAEDDHVRQLLDKRAEAFWLEVDTEMLMLDRKRPDLQAAYPLVMQDYIRAQQAYGIDEKLDETRLPQCARHYHNHWINKKLWYPSHDDGSPDWPSIYVFIVDHYYGYCLRPVAAD